MKDSFLPICVLVDNGGQDFLQVELVCIADVCAEESIPPVCFHPVLIVIGAQSEKGFRLVIIHFTRFKEMSDYDYFLQFIMYLSIYDHSS